MKKRKLRIAALCLLLAFKSLSAQNDTISSDTSNYHSRKLKTEEVNFVTGYYQQEGNNASVTGGIGSEHLTDVATTINLSIAKYDKKDNKHTIKPELGFDVYSSASSDLIDPTTVSSASSGDVRIYPSVNYNFENNTKNYEVGSALSFSNEFDYTSFGGNVSISKWSKSNNSEIIAKASVFLDEWKVILPLELRPIGYGSGAEDDPIPVAYKARNSYNVGLIYSRVVNKNLQVAFLADLAYQEGLLGTKFHRVYFNDGSAKTETLPETRTKVPLGFRASYFLGDNIVLRGFYRYYWDNWGIQAHTMSLELSYKITPFISLAPSYRYYTQTEANYFAPYQSHNLSATLFTSDYDLSKLNSSMFGLNARFSNLKGKLFVSKLNTLDLKYSYYKRSTGLYAHSITLALNFK